MRKVLLKNLCKPNEIGKYGIPASAEEYNDEKVRYLRISDIDDYGNLIHTDKRSVSSNDIEKYLLEEGDLVVARTGNSTGRTYFHETKNGELAFAGFLIKYGLDNRKVNPKYLKYYTISNEYRQWVKNLSVGSTRGNINAQTFADCPISLPEKHQQDLLVSVLSSFDDKIELNNRINAELEAMAKTLYDYWFVQFDFPDAEGKPYKSSGGKMVYNETLKREIPEGWEVKRLGTICIANAKQLKSAHNLSFINYLETSGITRNLVTVTQTISPTDCLPSRAKRILSPNDIIYSTVRPIQEHHGIIKKPLENMIVSTGFAVLSHINNPMLNDLIYQILRSQTTVSHLQTIADSSVSAYPSINPDDILSIQLAWPKDENVVLKLAAKLQAFNTMIYHNQQQNLEFANLRDWLLPMLMNGQVNVGEAYEQAASALRMAAEPEKAYTK